MRKLISLLSIILLIILSSSLHAEKLMQRDQEPDYVSDCRWGDVTL